VDPDADVLATDRGLVARHVAGPDDLAAVVAFLDEAEAAAGAPLVDESERQRLRTAVRGEADAAPGWLPILAQRPRGAAPEDAEAQPRAIVGYAGLVVPPAVGPHAADPQDGAGRGQATADVAVDRRHGDAGPTLRLLLTTVTEVARRHPAPQVLAWLRAATDADVTVAAAAGYGLERRLGVLGRALEPAPVADDPPPGVTVRAYRPDTDDEGVVAVLSAAYDGTPEDGWDRARFDERRRLPWFRPDDLLVAEDADGTLVGLHWLKRRTERVGEVYNLAIHPAGQGRGLGEALLTAGLAHLAATGCDEVLLWVDRANEPAVRLYTSRGFEPRWEDVALARSTAPGGSVHESSGPRPSR
jgi:mycothiol synthase